MFVKLFRIEQVKASKQSLAGAVYEQKKEQTERKGVPGGLKSTWTGKNIRTVERYLVYFAVQFFSHSWRFWIHYYQQNVKQNGEFYLRYSVYFSVNRPIQ